MNDDLKKILEEIKEIEDKLINQPMDISLSLRKSRLEDRFDYLFTYFRKK